MQLISINRLMSCIHRMNRVYGALHFMDMLWRLINCRIIFIIIVKD